MVFTFSRNKFSVVFFSNFFDPSGRLLIRMFVAFSTWLFQWESHKFSIILNYVLTFKIMVAKNTVSYFALVSSYGIFRPLKTTKKVIIRCSSLFFFALNKAICLDNASIFFCHLLCWLIVKPSFAIKFLANDKTIMNNIHYHVWHWNRQPYVLQRRRSEKKALSV